MRSILVLFVTLVFSLGCMGAVNSLTDLDLSVEMEENAVHPADFPVSAPASGKKLMSMGMTAGAESVNLPEGVDVDMSEDVRYRMELITYEVPSSDIDAMFEASKAEVEASGFTLKTSEDDAWVYEKDAVLFVLVDPAASDDEILTLIRLKPVVEETPE